MENISFLDIIKKSSQFRHEDYINYFFNEIASISNEKMKPIFAKYSAFPNTYISIVKDSTDRLLENKKGKLMERSWRNTIFYFVDKNTYIEHFGTNGLFPSFKIDNSLVIYTDSYNRLNSKYPNEPKFQYDIFKGFQETIFKYFKENKSSWFVRSYVYFVLVLCDKNSNITSKDFNIYYWNTNYSFKEVNGKQCIFNNVSNSYFVDDVPSELSLIEDTNRDAIDCVCAYTGKLDFRNQTEENYEDIKNDLEAGINYILVRGAARTGKTILAMKILGQYPQSKLLIMNYHFYIALKDSFHIKNERFPNKRIFHHDLSRSEGCWIENKQTKEIIPKLDFLIVDEAQRLAFVKECCGGYGFNLPELDEFKKILFNENQKTTILFGDDNQKLNPDYDKGLSKIHSMIKDLNFREYFFKNSIGIPPEILNNIKHLLNIGSGIPIQSSNNFIFYVTNDNEDFRKRFNEDKIQKKHYLCVGLYPFSNQYIKYSNGEIITYPKELNKADFPYLFNKEIISKYLLSTYEVISREIESVYLYLPEEISFDSDQNKITFKDKKCKISEDFLINHIYTLMTRATMKLSILCKNASLYSYLNKEINDINILNKDSLINDKSKFDADFTEDNIDYDYDFFIAYHGTNNVNGSYEKAKEICDFLKIHNFKVFLNEYSFNADDNDLGFNETTNVIQRSHRFLFVLNDSIYLDKNGMIPRKYENHKPNQLYSELRMFSSLVDDDLRNYKNDFKCFYDGSKYNKSNIYNFLNCAYREGTYGNSNCCYFELEDILKFTIFNKLVV